MSRSASQFAFGMREKKNCTNSKDPNESAPLFSDEIHHLIWRVRLVKIQTYFVSKYESYWSSGMSSWSDWCEKASNECLEKSGQFT